jgi:sulfatase modifying factor 1
MKVNSTKLQSFYWSLISCSIFILSSYSCKSNSFPTSREPGKKSLATGYAFNKGIDGFQVTKFKGQNVGSDLVFVEGGMMVVGDFDDDLTNPRNSFKRNVSVASFFIGRTPVVNLEWREYLHWLKINSTQEEYQAALPNSQVWKRDLAYNDPYIDNYSDYLGFNFFPVVGISYNQAVKYCSWKTKYVNNRLAKEAGYTIDFLADLRKAPEPGDDSDISAGDQDTSLGDSDQDTTDQNVDADADMQMMINELKSKGVLLPSEYRLPTEMEWEYAARALIGVQDESFVQEAQRIYPWSGLSIRDKNGKFLANFKRGRGNYKGVAGESNYNGPTTHVYAYPPNDLGIYDIVGNVCEYVLDVYRPDSIHDMDDFNPVRRDGSGDESGDYKSSNPLINDNAIVYKGASWKDCAYWLAISKRRYTDKNASTDTVGFRCAMTSAGD